MTRTDVRAALAAAAATLGLAASAQDRADLERARIVGNRELPKVLYIVPWKKPLSAAGIGRPAGGVLDDALQPIDREVFRRGLRFDAQLRARSADEASAQAAAAPPAAPLAAPPAAPPAAPLAAAPAASPTTPPTTASTTPPAHPTPGAPR